MSHRVFSDYYKTFVVLPFDTPSIWALIIVDLQYNIFLVHLLSNYFKNIWYVLDIVPGNGDITVNYRGEDSPCPYGEVRELKWAKDILAM